ncbi:uncharacterized protein [Drosophila kikkawai]|uniref:Uncharacterized protein LOC108085285 n=1 Tax=Drosophila kikkawai TaxID=30033 RepID=A0A6P4J8X0_DROKI|nr:uncharacterized protein LOC108085285 [Drosophila kikkawai]XP_017037326.1 uncharacterized protein LOC108085285 [Drosophila kikkawai]XP_017037327.1 uncharacterized protein LOC108085285 [Drosophila kikkawai]XP_017037328.1 uncharacterized protein LOC108085285 [Drosophila kikkawai]XP_017037330.1 uncharacterized protein LOC108085285 [Drosophila kikkawai]
MADSQRCAVKRPFEMESEDLDEDAGPSTKDNKGHLKTLLDQGSKPKDQMGELAKRLRSLESKLEANTKMLEANSKELAKSTLQVSKLAALLQLLLKGNSKDVGVEESFPIPDQEALAALEFKIVSSTKNAYILAITDLLNSNTLTKSLKGVMAESLICDFNLDGVNGKKSLRAFPEFFSVLIESIGMMKGQQSPEKALAHAMSCVKNNANKKRNSNK